MLNPENEAQQNHQNKNESPKISKQIIHQSPNIDMLKKMFSRTKNRSQFVPNEQSLLFNPQDSLAALKAYRKRRKIIIEQSLHRNQLEANVDEKRQINMESTIDSPEKISFQIQSVKYNFQKNNMTKKFYDEIIQKIQECSLSDNVDKLPIIQPKKVKKVFSRNFSQNQRENRKNNLGLNWQKDTLPALNQLKSETIKGNKIQKLSQMNGAVSKTIEHDCQNNQIAEFYRVKNLKNCARNTEGSRILVMKASLRSSLQNPEKKGNFDFSGKEQIQNNYGTFSVCKLPSSSESTINPESQILPSLKPVKSVASLASVQNRPKGYMYFHSQAKSFLKQHKAKMLQPAKIKQFLISGITATSYAIIDLTTMLPVAHKNFDKRIQIASISKIMTCYLTLLACKKYNVDMKKCQVRISEVASTMTGTSAGLEVGDCLTLQELLYGLMLPSGNDASVAIAQTIGKIIQRYKKKQTKKSYYETFIAHMNILSRQLKLEDQDWKNSSGLPQQPNHSTPKDIVLLTIAAMMNQKFRQIVSTKEYDVMIKNDRTGLKKWTKWKNTNKLLIDGWQGVKTGNTDAAGYCLMAKKQRYLICVFDSKSMSKRFSECSQLYQLVKSKQRYLFPQKWD